MPTLLCASMKSVLTSSCKAASYYKSQLSNDAQCVVEFDRSLMENVICIRSDVNSEPVLRLPRDNRPLSALNIKHSLIALQTQLTDLEHFAIHLWLRQSAMQSVKLILSTSVKAAQRERLIDGTVQLKLPLIVPRKRWIQIIFHLPGILQHLFKESPVIAIDAVHIAGHARLRSLMTSDDEQSCIDSTPPGFALFAVPAYTAPVWITAHSATTPRGSNNNNSNNNVSHATPSASGNASMERECCTDQNNCLAARAHNSSQHVNFSEQPINHNYDKTSSVQIGNNHSSSEENCNEHIANSEPLNMTTKCTKINKETSSSSSSTSMLSSLTSSCLPPLKRANKNEQMTLRKQTSLTHTDKTYSSLEELHLSEETNTLSPSNSSKSESVTSTRQWPTNEVTNNETGANCEHNSIIRNTPIKLEPILASSTSDTSAENYTTDNNVIDTNIKTIKSSIGLTDEPSRWDSNKDHLHTSTTVQPNINCKNTHTPLPHNTKRKNNGTYIKLLDSTKPCNCNPKENANINTSSNNGSDSRSVSGDVERRRRTKDKEVNVNKYDCICAWHTTLPKTHRNCGQKAEQQLSLVSSNTNRNVSNKHNRNKNDEIVGASMLSHQYASVNKTRTKSTKQTLTATPEEQVHRFNTICNETCEIPCNNNSANIVILSNDNRTSIVVNARSQTNNVLATSNMSENHNLNNETCKSSLINEKPLYVTTTLCKHQEEPFQQNQQSKRQQKHRCTYDTERRFEEKEQLRKKKMSRFGRRLKLLRVNAKRRQQEYVQTFNCDGRASNISVSQVLRELSQQETNSSQIIVSQSNNNTETNCNIFMYGFGVGYLGVLRENGEYQLDSSFEDSDSDTFSKDLLLSHLHLVSNEDSCNE